MWKTKISNFLVTRAPEMVAALEWTQRQERIITEAKLEEFAESRKWRRSLAGERPTDLRILGHHLWGFLNVNLSGDAFTIFGNIPRSQGFEAWRKVMKGLNERSTAELMKLETKVLSPPECGSEGQVLMAIEQWEGSLKRYLDAGGEDLSEQRRRGGLLRLLPEKLRDRVIWDLGEEQKHDAIIEWLQKRLRQSSAWHSKSHAAAMVEPEDRDDANPLDEEAMEELHALGDSNRPWMSQPSSKETPRGKPAGLLCHEDSRFNPNHSAENQAQ